eukprot:2117379-Amphidinium_carterae.1
MKIRAAWTEKHKPTAVLTIPVPRLSHSDTPHINIYLALPRCTLHTLKEAHKEREQNENQ